VEVATALALTRSLSFSLYVNWIMAPPGAGGGAIADPSVGLDSDSLCGLLLGCLAFGSRRLLHRLLLCSGLLCLFRSECLLDLGQVIDFVLVGNADVRAECQPQCEFRELNFLQPIRDCLWHGQMHATMPNSRSPAFSVVIPGH
jgi:hypothetical protein